MGKKWRIRRFVLRFLDFISIRNLAYDRYLSLKGVKISQFSKLDFQLYDRSPICARVHPIPMAFWTPRSLTSSKAVELYL
jgi:hypothetical protein